MSEEKHREKLPKHYRVIQEKHPLFAEMHARLAETVRSEGPIDTKTGHLIQLAASAAVRSEGAVHSHARRALAAGATKEELRHAVILLTTTIGFPAVAAALDWLNDVI